MSGFIAIKRQAMREILTVVPKGGKHRLRANVSAVILHLLLDVAYQPTRLQNGIELCIGQWSFGLDEYAAKVGLPLQQFRTALKRLEKLGVIRVESNTFGTLVTISNYNGLVEVFRQDQHGSTADQTHVPSETDNREHSTINTKQNDNAWVGEPTHGRQSTKMGNGNGAGKVTKRMSLNTSDDSKIYRLLLGIGFHIDDSVCDPKLAQANQGLVRDFVANHGEKALCEEIEHCREGDSPPALLNSILQRGPEPQMRYYEGRDHGVEREEDDDLPF